MMIDRRRFIVGSAAGAAAFVTPLLHFEKVGAAGFAATAAVRPRPRDYAVCDPWLVHSVEGAPRLVIHELSGAVFRLEYSSTENGARHFVLDRIWTDYTPPYPIACLDFEADATRPMLRQSLPPGLNRSVKPHKSVDLEAIRAAVGSVVDFCLERAKPLNAWMMVRPTTSGESLIMPAPPSGFGAPTHWAFPSELRAKLARGFLSA
jgi:hypothetical protein